MTQTIYEINIDETENEKNETLKVLSDLGITPSQAIEMFFAHIRLTRSIPFPID